MRHMWTPYIPEGDRWCIVYLHRHARARHAEYIQTENFSRSCMYSTAKRPWCNTFQNIAECGPRTIHCRTFGVSVKIQNGGRHPDLFHQPSIHFQDWLWFGVAFGMTGASLRTECHSGTPRTQVWVWLHCTGMRKHILEYPWFQCHLHPFL